MSLTGPFAWLGWLLLALVPPLIFLLYFLKLRRSKIEVPSTFLWTRTIEDLQVNSLWQRLRSSILLWLQLLIALLLLMTVLRPGCDGTQRIGGRHILLLDTSASMNATDLEGSRFQEAKQQIETFIEQMNADDLAMLMTANDKSQIRQSYTSDRALLRRKLLEVQISEHLTDMEEALAAATGLANPSQIRDVDNVMSPEEIALAAKKDQATLYMFSDGGFPSVKDASLGILDVRFIPLGKTDINNLGIISFNGELSKVDRNRVELFARIENFADRPADMEVQLYRNGASIDAIRREGIAAGEIISLDFQDRVPTVDREVVEYQLRIQTKDQLDADNFAHCAINPGRKPRVMLITPGNANLLAALSTSLIGQGLELEVQDSEFVKSDAFDATTKYNSYDLIIFDRVQPARLPLANTIFWGVAPSDDWILEELEQPIFVLYSNNVHPMISGLALDSLAFLEAKRIKGPQSSTELLAANDGTIMMIAPRGGFQDLVMGFPLIVQRDGGTMPVTDWPGRLSFPIFIHNALEFLAGLGQKEINSSIRPGELVNFRLEDGGDEVMVKSPSGQTQRIKRQKTGGFVFTGADELGIYQVLDQTDKHRLSFAVSLSDRRESDIKVKEQFTVGYSEVESGKSIEANANSNLWRYLLLTALLLVVVEWYVYNRRILM